MLNPSLMSTATQRILSQSSNISYTARGVYRVQSVPDDRKAEYMWRDFVMTLVCAYLGEASMRALDTYLTIPLMTEKLGLNNLSEQYQGVFGQPGEKIANYDKLPEVLRKRITGSLVKGNSVGLIPSLLEEMDNGKSDLSPLDRKILIHHLYKKLNFPEFLKKKLAEEAKHLTPDDIATIAEHWENLVKLRGDGAKKFTGKLTDILKAPLGENVTVAAREAKLGAVETEYGKMFTLATQEQRDGLQALFAKVKALVPQEKIADDTLKEIGEDAGKLFKWSEEQGARQLANLGKLLPENGKKAEILKWVQEGLHSHGVWNALKSIQKSATWPKIVLTVSTTFLFYGLAANYFDVKILQPWQKKLVQERGHSRDIIGPSYLGLIPGMAVLLAGLSDRVAPKALKNMGYFGRFVLVGGAALATYGASVYALVQAKLKNNPPNFKPLDPSPADKAPAPTAPATKPARPPLTELPTALRRPPVQQVSGNALPAEAPGFSAAHAPAAFTPPAYAASPFTAPVSQQPPPQQQQAPALMQAYSPQAQQAYFARRIER